MPSAAFATNHFKLGTQWTVKVGYDPASQKTIVYTLEDGAYPETEEQDALTLFCTDENGERTLEAVILCEGEKVFFYDYDSPGRMGTSLRLFSAAERRDHPVLRDV